MAQSTPPQKPPVKPPRSDAAPEAQGPAPHALPMLYVRPEPLDPKRHGELRLRGRSDFSTFRQAGIAPITLSEIPIVARHFPIVFLAGPAGQPPSVAAVLGSGPNENLCVGPDGAWRAETYVPAYFRRYPFITSATGVDGRTAVFLDAASDKLSTSEGDRLFENDQPTQLTRDAMEFCGRFHRDAAATAALCQALAAAGVLADRAVQARDRDTPRLSWRGFMAVDEKRLAEVADQTFLDWRNRGWLAAIYLHLFSIGLFADIARRKLGAPGSAPETNA